MFRCFGCFSKSQVGINNPLNVPGKDKSKVSKCALISGLVLFIITIAAVIFALSNPGLVGFASMSSGCFVSLIFAGSLSFVLAVAIGSVLVRMLKSQYKQVKSTNGVYKSVVVNKYVVKWMYLQVISSLLEEFKSLIYFMKTTSNKVDRIEAAVRRIEVTIKTTREHINNRFDLVDILDTLALRSNDLKDIVFETVIECSAEDKAKIEAIVDSLCKAVEDLKIEMTGKEESSAV